MQGLNVHTIAIQVPKRDLTVGGHDPDGPSGSGQSVIGVWATASRQRVQGLGRHRTASAIGTARGGRSPGSATRCSTRSSCRWPRRTGGTASTPSDDNQFAKYVLKPELARLLPVLYPGVFPHLAAYTKPRADLDAILLTGIPAGVVPGFQNFTGTGAGRHAAPQLAIPPSANPNPLGLVAGDPAGIPQRAPASSTTW